MCSYTLAMAALADLALTPVLASERLLPVTAALEAALPQRGIQRGSTVLVTAEGVPGCTSLALELLVGISMSGSWCAVAGYPGLGLVAASERGLELSRLLLVPDPGDPERCQRVVAALFDAVDAVLLVPPRSIRPADARWLAVRARDRHSVLMVLDREMSWAGPADLRCSVTASSWSGLGKGYGLLRSHSMEIEVTGRGAAARPRRVSVSLSA